MFKSAEFARMDKDAAKNFMDTAGKTFDIGGPEVLTYREMIQQYTEAVEISRRIILRAPVLSSLLAPYWAGLVTPIPSGIAHPLIEGLKNEVVCLDDSITEYIPIEKTPFKASVKIAVSEKVLSKVPEREPLEWDKIE